MIRQKNRPLVSKGCIAHHQRRWCELNPEGRERLIDNFLFAISEMMEYNAVA